MQKLARFTGMLAALLATPAYAYIGPGAGAGAIAVVLGVIASVFLAFVAIIWYPIKRLLKSLKSRNRKTGAAPPDSDAE